MQTMRKTKYRNPMECEYPPEWDDCCQECGSLQLYIIDDGIAECEECGWIEESREDEDEDYAEARF